MVGQKHANNGQVDDELVGLLFHLVLVSYEDEIVCIYTSHKESPFVDQAHAPHPCQPLGLPVPLHLILLSSHPREYTLQ